jgi:hypothetical protein
MIIIQIWSLGAVFHLILAVSTVLLSEHHGGWHFTGSDALRSMRGVSGMAGCVPPKTQTRGG